MSEYDGLVAVVTGGAAGIGAACARMLRERGARVAVLDLVPSSDQGLLSVECDVADTTSVQVAVQQVVDTLGGLDIVVNNAGVGAVGDVTAQNDTEWARVLDINVIGMARVTAAALPHLRRSQHAAVVTTCSAVAVLGVRNRALYSASKGAVLALTLAMAADHVQEGIRINAVAPGTTDTPWVGRLLDDAPDPTVAAEALRARQPLGRLVSADEIAHAVCHLASPLSGATTGAVLRVDGGMTSLRL